MGSAAAEEIMLSIICTYKVHTMSHWTGLLSCVVFSSSWYLKEIFRRSFHQFIIPHFSESIPVQSLSHVQLFVTPWTAAHQASLSIINSRSLLKLMSTESVMPSNLLILCHHLLPLPSILSSIRIFSNESVLRIRWPKY